MTSEAAVESRLILGDDTARSLVAQFGTPLYVIDESHLRARAKRYLAAFSAVAPRSQVAYASKANSTLAVLAILKSEGCLIDAASEGELRAAISAGASPDRIHLHGNAKTRAEIEYAVSVGVGQIVVDNFAEIDALKDFATRIKEVSLRLAPGVDPKTNEKISTGQADTKFGFNIGDGSAENSVQACLGAGLPLVGFHCHVGSQLLDPGAQIAGAELIAQFAAQMSVKNGFEARSLNFGGGMGIRYEDSYQEIDVEDFCRQVVMAARRGLEGTRLDPVFVQEPGRWLVGESCVTLYSVNNVKDVPIREGKRRYVSVDGGLSDNPRPALYGSKYPVRHVPGGGARVILSPVEGGAQNTRVSGKHCETDTLFDGIDLPKDVQSGDLLQILCTGAYNSAMASNYNRYPRPATVLVRPNGQFALIQERETWDDLFRRERIPEDLA